MLIDYYYGSYGATIRIDILSFEELIFMKNLFNEFAMQKKQKFSFNDIPFATINGLHKFYMYSTSKIINKSVAIFIGGEKEIICHWSNRPSGWDQCEGLIDGIMESKHPSHQYFSDVEIDDALIAIYYIERKV